MAILEKPMVTVKRFFTFVTEFVNIPQFKEKNMDDLSTGRCLPCEGGQPPLTPEQMQQYCVQLPEWSLNESKTAISRRFSFKVFQKTISFINAVAWIVNQENHHPTLEAGYDYCTITFTTHAVKGLTPNDFICAAKIDKLL
jgi:4a-hydroxytetrahydrobiopterin dehydratase